MKKIKSLFSRLYLYAFSIARFVTLCRRIFQRKGRPTVWIFGTPTHSNLGDQAQTFCIERWSRKNFPSHGVFGFPQFSSRLDYLLLRVLRRTISRGDVLFCHSGYHMTELYPLYKIYTAVAKTFPDFPLTIFPQTVNFLSDKEAADVAKIFDAHPNCTLLCRDEISFAAAQKIFRKTKLLLFPDIVTSLIGTKHYDFSRDGVIFCMRNDKEAFYKPEQIAELRERFKPAKTELSDTTITVPADEIADDRNWFLETTFEKYAHGQVMITDRYHGTIFSLIAGTPVIVVGSTDHKLSSGVKWFPPEIFGGYIAFAKNLDEAFRLAADRMIHPPKNTLPPYFKENFYDKLSERLLEEKQ